MGTAAAAMLSGAPFLAPAARAQPAPQHPNVLFIMTDDIGWEQVGLYHRGIGLGETPNIDRIGQEGAMRFARLVWARVSLGAPAPCAAV